MRTLLSFGALACLNSLAAAQVTFTEVAVVDLDSTANPANAEFIGTNPSAVTLSGSRLTVAGFNGSGTDGEVAIVEVLNPFGASAFSPRFGVLPTPALRGYSGLDSDASGNVAAAYDDGTTNTNGIALYQNGTQAWTRTARGGSGVAFDPGFMGVDSGVAWTTFGSGRRSLQDTNTGVDIYDSTNGMIILTGEGTFWRDMDFEANGDIWLREGNNVISWNRNGGNSVTSSAVVVDPTDADFVNGQNLAYLEGLDLVIYNDRPAPTGNQDFFTIVKVIQPDGTPVTVDWGTFMPGPGAAYYDFSWDADTGTLALLDFTNRNVHLFRINPVGSAYCVSTANTTGFPATLSAIGSTSIADNDLTIFCQPVPTQPGLFFFGPNQIQLAFGNGFRCVGGQVVRLSPQTPVNGIITNSPDLSFLGILPGSVNFQFWYRDPGAVGATFNLSDGLEVVFVP